MIVEEYAWQLFSNANKHRIRVTPEPSTSKPLLQKCRVKKQKAQRSARKITRHSKG